MLEEKGATLVEYALGLVLIAAVFIVGAVLLEEVAKNRREKALNATKETVPCSANGLSNDECL